MRTWQAQLRAARTRGGAAPAWWAVDGHECEAAYDPAAAATYAASVINLSNPATHALTAVGTPDWQAGVGWVGSGWYFGTDIVPQGTWSFVAQFADVTTPGGLFGTRQTSGATRLGMFAENGAAASQYGWGDAYSATPRTDGIMGQSGAACWFGTSKLATIAGTGPGAITRAALIRGVNNNGTPVLFLAGTMSRLAVYPSIIPDDAFVALIERMAAL